MSLTIKELKEEIRIMEANLLSLKHELSDAIEEEGRVQRESSEQRQWLAEMTARQAHYHSR